MGHLVFRQEPFSCTAQVQSHQEGSLDPFFDNRKFSAPQWCGGDALFNVPRMRHPQHPTTRKKRYLQTEPIFPTCVTHAAALSETAPCTTPCTPPLPPATICDRICKRSSSGTRAWAALRGRAQRKKPHADDDVELVRFYYNLSRRMTDRYRC